MEDYENVIKKNPDWEGMVKVKFPARVRSNGRDAKMVTIPSDICKRMNIRTKQWVSVEIDPEGFGYDYGEE